MGKMVYGRCLVCDKDFMYEKSDRGGPPRKYCSRQCSYVGNKLLAKVKAKDRNETKRKKPRTLDDAIKELRQSGMSESDYADIQRQKTLQMVGGVRI